MEKVQYASLMKELQKAIVSKKEPPSVTSPQSNTSDSATASDEKTQNSKSSSRSDGTKNSDADFSKELEAALQLIQDLESPNTIETPSETKSPLDGGGPTRALAVWRNSSDASEESEKTLSAVGSLAEITSPITECQPELYSFKPQVSSTNGKFTFLTASCLAFIVQRTPKMTLQVLQLQFVIRIPKVHLDTVPRPMDQLLIGPRRRV